MLPGPSFVPKKTHSLLILCHGYGASGEDLMSLVPDMVDQLPETAFFCPNAPQTLPFGGFEWFSLEDYGSEKLISRTYLEKLSERALPAARRIISFAEELAEKFSLPMSKIALAGFSQGGLIAQEAAFLSPENFAGVVGFSSVPFVFMPQNHAAKDLSQTPVLLTHGDADTVIPFQALAFSKNELARQKIKPQSLLVPHLGHGIDEQALETAVHFLRNILY